MSNEEKRYAGLESLRKFLENCKAIFAAITHTHSKEDIEDLMIDTALSETSENPVQNKAISAEINRINEALDDKADTEHNHDDVYYTESEIDGKLEAVNESITNITNGDIVVKESEHATSADSATNATNAVSAQTAENATHATSADSASEATHATSADSATTATTATTAGSAEKATQDASGNVITETYETKENASAKLAEAKGYTDEKIAAIPTPDVSGQIGTHNTATDAHNDIRVLINDLRTMLNNFLDVDDETKDQLSEVITLIENNKGTLESLTTSKVNVSDIIDNLITNSSSKVLSAAQGVVIKGLIDALQTEVDSKANSNDLTSHTGNTTVHITSTERTNWNDAVSKEHTHSNKTILDNTTASYTTEDKTKLEEAASESALAMQTLGYSIEDEGAKTVDERFKALPDPIKVSEAVSNTDVSYTKSIPSDSAIYAKVNMLGGMTYKVNTGTEEEPVYELRSAPVTEIESVGVNLIPYPYYNTTISNNGIDWVDNGDGTITVNGTATANTFFTLASQLKLFKGDYVLSVDGGFSGCQIYTSVNGNFIYAEKNSAKFSMQEDAILSDRITIKISSGITVSNLTLKPMLRKAEITDETWKPYIKTSTLIPSAVQALDGYGEGISDTLYNYVDWEKKQFVRNVGKVDLGTLSWKYVDTFGGSFLTSISTMKIGTAASECSKYQVVTSNINNVDKAIYTINNGQNVYVKDSAYTDATVFKAAMSGVMLYYELATPEIIDISDILADNTISVEGGGTLTFKNEYEYDVPSEVVYYNNNIERVAANEFVGTATSAIYDSEGNKIADKLSNLAHIDTTDSEPEEDPTPATLSVIDPTGAEESDIGSAADAYKTKVAMSNTDIRIKELEDENAELKAQITELNSKLETKMQIMHFTETTGTGDSVGGISIPRSKYPGSLAIIPLGYDVSSVYKVALSSISDTYFGILVQNANNNAWADGVTVSFYALVLY